MSTRMFLGVVIFLILIGTGAVLFILHQRAELAHLEEQARESEKLLTSSERPDASPQRRGVSPTTYRPPPMGETADTGEWVGDVWHQRPAPNPKKRGFWSEDPNKLLRMLVAGDVPADEDDEAFVLRIIAEHPYSQAALEARLLESDYGDEDLRLMLKYHPHSPRLHTLIASALEHGSPEEAVAYAKKALRLLPNSSEDHSYLDLDDKPHVHNHITLGRAYQRLGNYKAALVHLKTARSLLEPGMNPAYAPIEKEIDGEVVKLHSDWTTSWYYSMSEYIAAIEAGKPLLGPTLSPVETAAPSLDALGGLAVPVAPVETSAPPPSSFDISAFPVSPFEREQVSPVDPAFGSAAGMRPADAARLVPETFDASQGEFGDFLRWMERIESAESPDVLDNFLMYELAKQLQGGKSQFTPDRLIRAFETMNRHGEQEGMTQLRNRDKALAEEMARHQRSRNRAPQRTAPVRPQTK